MTLITPCESPKHSKWHLISGSLVVAIVYSTTVALVSWLTH